MNNVIYVEFGKKNVVFDIEPGLTIYLNTLRELGVEEDDIRDTLDAINNVDVYLAADEVVQELADGWLEQFI